MKEQLFVENDNFVTLTPGEPIRLFPFGKLTRAGKVIDFTKELAARMKLPRYKPAIKLGSHEDVTPSGGSIESLLVGEDGLYAIPAFTEKGAKAVEDGDYRYHSPEVIWDGRLEDVVNGDLEAPLITGLALLHDPALGAAAALYQVEDLSHKEIQMEVLEKMQEENKNFLGKLGELFTAKKKEDDKQTEAFTALETERNEYKAKLDKLQAEKEREESLAAIKSEFATEEFGAAYQALNTDENAEMLASMSEEQRAWVNTNLRALSAQIAESKLLGEEGEAGEEGGEEGADKVDAIVRKYMADKKVDYVKAVAELTKEQPDLFKEI